MTVLVEACVETAAQAGAAAAAGADRVELCRRLDLGGLTPAPEALAAARSVLRIPLHVLVRPRAGDFAWSAAELDEMAAAIAAAKAAEADGVVLGALTPDGRVDQAATRRLVEAARPLSVTFHRAFDETVDQPAALRDLIALGIDRVLTSGGRPTAREGADALRRLVEAAGGRIAVMAGGGIRPGNVAEVVGRSGVREVHARMDDDPGRASAMRRALEGSREWGVESGE